MFVPWGSAAGSGGEARRLRGRPEQRKQRRRLYSVAHSLVPPFFRALGAAVVPAGCRRRHPGRAPVLNLATTHNPTPSGPPAADLLGPLSPAPRDLFAAAARRGQARATVAG